MRRFNLYLGAFMVGAIILLALFAPLLVSVDPYESDPINAGLMPDADFWMGTDEIGRDIFSRVLYGARLSLAIGIGIQIMNTVIGVLLGMSAGYFGGWWDDVVQALTNVMLAVPSIVFALALMTLFGAGIFSLILALGLTDWAYSCRIARAQVLSEKNKNYVKASKTMGFKKFHILFREILPNIIGPLIIVATMGLGSAIMAEASFSYLGLGVVPPNPSWGGMIAKGMIDVEVSYWVVLYPALALCWTVVGFNLLGDGLRDYFDPHDSVKA